MNTNTRTFSKKSSNLLTLIKNQVRKDEQQDETMDFYIEQTQDRQNFDEFLISSDKNKSLHYQKIDKKYKETKQAYIDYLQSQMQSGSLPIQIQKNPNFMKIWANLKQTQAEKEKDMQLLMVTHQLGGTHQRMANTQQIPSTTTESVQNNSQRYQVSYSSSNYSSDDSLMIVKGVKKEDENKCEREISKVPSSGHGKMPKVKESKMSQALQAQCKKMEQQALRDTGFGLRKIEKEEYFEALCYFNKASSIFNISQLTPGLKRVKERLYNHLVDSFLCQCHCYLKMRQSYDLVLSLLNQILLVEPHHKAALFLKWKVLLLQDDILKATQEEMHIQRILPTKGITLGRASLTHMPLLKMKAVSFVEREVPTLQDSKMDICNLTEQRNQESEFFSDNASTQASSNLSIKSSYSCGSKKQLSKTYKYQSTVTDITNTSVATLQQYLFKYGIKNVIKILLLAIIGYVLKNNKYANGLLNVFNTFNKTMQHFVK